jgi:hypothetical protein
MLPRLFAPSRYDYRRPIPDEALEDGECQCVICMNPVVNSVELKDLPVDVLITEEEESDHEETDNEERIQKSVITGIMVTPCSHVFHGECLSKWLDYKMECPTCRKPLPEL